MAPVSARGLTPLAEALRQQIDALVDYQARAYAWEVLGETPPEGFDTEAKRQDFLMRTATSITTLRDQLETVTLDQLKEQLNDEQMRWLEHRADAVTQTLMNGGRSGEGTGQADGSAQTSRGGERANDQPYRVDEDGWVVRSYRNFWASVDRFAREYCQFAQHYGLRFLKDSQVHPGPRGGDGPVEYDTIDVPFTERREPSGDGSVHPGIVGVAFAIVPAGQWRVEKIKRDPRTEPWEETWMLRAVDGSACVRLRDRSLRIFGAWAKNRDRVPKPVLHLVIEDGAKVNGTTEAHGRSWIRSSTRWLATWASRWWTGSGTITPGTTGSCPKSPAIRRSRHVSRLNPFGGLTTRWGTRFCGVCVRSPGDC